MTNIQIDCIIKNIKRLPEVIELEILSFLIPQNIKFIDFTDCYPIDNISECNYSKRYKVAIYKDNRIYKKSFYKSHNNYCFTNYFLSYIPKKNKKHRYYITKEKIRQVCRKCGTNLCHISCSRGMYDEIIFYTSQYVGLNLNYALIELLF